MTTNYTEGFYLIPSHMREGVTRYIEKGFEPGGFLYAVLSNDFYKAVIRADVSNLAMLRDWAHLLSYLPSGSWGSEDKVRKWIIMKGLSGVKNQNQS